ncbi:MAG TPA: phosphatase PAP2 family protein [Polyangiaceae bacterium]|nr:phosphatase PAP2 family protein [Polyangiaceae bacterium]
MPPTSASAQDGATAKEANPSAPTPSEAPDRKGSLDPKPLEPSRKGRTTFDIDPLADGALLAVALGFAGTLAAVNSTGEIRPQQISANFDTADLLAIDRGAVNRAPSTNSGVYSNIAVSVALGYAVLDPILSGVREKSVQTALADGFMYAESLSLTLATTNLVKMAVRRPRPIAYIEANAHKDDPNYANNSTDSALSFFSSHAAVTATLGATATYLAFARAPHRARPWITLLIGVGLTTFVSVERVYAGQHFPTDVIAGSLAGAGIGVIVPHLHRTDDIKERRIWVGFSPLHSLDGERGGLVNLTGLF